MSTKQFAAKMKEEVEKAKSSGTTAIPCDNLIAYLEKVLEAPESSSVDLEPHKEENKYLHESSLEMFKAVILFGLSAMNSAFILNGAAAVTLLAFIGHLIQLSEDKVADFSPCLFCFSLGALFAAIALSCAYLSQMFYSSQSRRGDTLRYVCIGFVIGSYGSFVAGLIFTYHAFNAYG